MLRFFGLAVAIVVILSPIVVGAAEPASESFTLNGALIGPTETIPAASEQFRFVPDSATIANQAQSERYALDGVSDPILGRSQPETQSPPPEAAPDQSSAVSGRSGSARPARMFALVDPSWSGELLLVVSVVLIAGGLELAYLGRRPLTLAHRP